MTDQCSICGRPDVALIDAMLSAGSSLRITARHFGASRSALDRHREHGGPDAAQEPARQASGGDGVATTDSPPALETSGAVDLARRLAVQVEVAMTRAEGSALDELSRARVLGSLSVSLARLQRITGESPPELSEPQIMQLPAFRRLLDTIFGALAAWPDAYQAVLAALKAADAKRSRG